jgi:hypothetical protein
MYMSVLKICNTIKRKIFLHGTGKVVRNYSLFISSKIEFHGFSFLN